MGKLRTLREEKRLVTMETLARYHDRVVAPLLAKVEALEKAAKEQEGAT